MKAIGPIARHVENPTQENKQHLKDFKEINRKTEQCVLGGELLKSGSIEATLVLQK